RTAPSRRHRAGEGLARGRARTDRGRSRGRLMAQFLIGGTAALLICIFLSPKFIEFLRRREFGQHVRDDGPQGHLGKAGTPTMGGVLIVIAIVTPFGILSTWHDWRATGVLVAALGCALIGFIDDYMKIVKR